MVLKGKFISVTFACSHLDSESNFAWKLTQSPKLYLWIMHLLLASGPRHVKNNRQWKLKNVDNQWKNVTIHVQRQMLHQCKLEVIKNNQITSTRLAFPVPTPKGFLAFRFTSCSFCDLPSDPGWKFLLNPQTFTFTLVMMNILKLPFSA